MMDRSLLPDPEVLRRRHLAFVAVEEMLGPSQDGFRYYGAEPPDHCWFNSGSGDSYDLVIVDDEAVLVAFDHESPRSPWSREDRLPEWPGMFEGLPDRLRGRLPEREEDEPLSVSACFWFVGGRWHEGESEPVQREGDVYDDDPGGAAVLLAPLLDPQAEVRELVTFVYEQPERLDDALALVRERGIDQCVSIETEAEARVGATESAQSDEQQNCKMNATAVAIYAHRHTVAYRIELTGPDLMHSEDRERLGLWLKAYRIIAAAAALSSAPRRVID